MFLGELGGKPRRRERWDVRSSWIAYRPSRRHVRPPYQYLYRRVLVRLGSSCNAGKSSVAKKGPGWLNCTVIDFQISRPELQNIRCADCHAGASLLGDHGVITTKWRCGDLLVRPGQGSFSFRVDHDVVQGGLPISKESSLRKLAPDACEAEPSSDDASSIGAALTPVDRGRWDWRGLLGRLR